MCHSEKGSETNGALEAYFKQALHRCYDLVENNTNGSL